MGSPFGDCKASKYNQEIKKKMKKGLLLAANKESMGDIFQCSVPPKQKKPGEFYSGGPFLLVLRGLSPLKRQGRVPPQPPIPHAEDWMQGRVHAKQAALPLSHVPSPEDSRILTHVQLKIMLPIFRV